MTFLVALVVEGIFAGAIYTLVALAFVVAYKASRLINFALGEASADLVDHGDAGPRGAPARRC